MVLLVTVVSPHNSNTSTNNDGYFVFYKPALVMIIPYTVIHFFYYYLNITYECLFATLQKCNALLESPTGTGKTLCLLCATLAWRKSLGGFSTGQNGSNGQDTGTYDGPLTQSAKTNVPTILYASRTHSQLRQVIQELRRTSYRSGMIMVCSA